MKYLLKANHPVLKRIDATSNDKQELDDLTNDLKVMGYEIESVTAVNEWEEFTIEITQDPQDIHPEDEMSDVTERFESELFRLVKKYQGQAGLQFKARNSESEITEW